MQGPFEEHILWPYYGHILGTSGIIDFLSGKVDLWAQLQTSGLVDFNVVQCMNWLCPITRLEVSGVESCDQQKKEISQNLDCYKVGMLSWRSR